MFAFLVRVLVRMMFEGHFAIGFFDFIGLSFSVDFEDFVVTALHFNFELIIYSLIIESIVLLL